MRWLHLVILAAAGPSAATANPRFLGLGDLPGGAFFSRADAVSGDGSVVVGASESADGTEAFRWHGGTMTGLGFLPSDLLFSAALAVSEDGSTVAGWSFLQAEGDDQFEAFRWNDNVMGGIGHLPGGEIKKSIAHGISDDGMVIVGADLPDDQAFRWEDGVMVALDDEGAVGSRALSISHDKSVIVGWASGEAVVWKDGLITGLGFLPGLEGFSRAEDVSSDGSIIVGVSSSSVEFHMEAFRFDGETMTSLGDLPGGEIFSQALGVSGDGSVVVGWGVTGSPAEFHHEAFVWTVSEGTQRLQDRLENIGLDLSGWTLEEATDISNDGNTIVGFGTNPSGDTEAWLAVVPEPPTELSVGLVLAVLAFLRASANRHARPRGVV